MTQRIQKPIDWSQVPEFRSQDPKLYETDPGAGHVLDDSVKTCDNCTYASAGRKCPGPNPNRYRVGGPVCEGFDESPESIRSERDYLRTLSKAGIP